MNNSSRWFTACGALGLLIAAMPRAQAPAPRAFDLEEATIAQLQQRMASGRDTARSIAEKYLARIDAIDRAGPALHSVIEMNPDALAIADRLDAERKSGRPRGPLHGIPVLLKDNIATADRMMTTAGSLALAGTPAAEGRVHRRAPARRRRGDSRQDESQRVGELPLDAFVERLERPRRPDAESVRARSQARRARARARASPIAANLAAVAIGTETDGSIVSPSSNNSLVGIKPTLGLVSRSGIVPIAHSQDTAGPMARTVADAAALLGALAGADPTRRRPTRRATRRAGATTRTSLDADGLKGARIGVVRNRLFGYSPAADRARGSGDRRHEDSRARRSSIPPNIPTLGKFDDSEFDVLLYEFKADLNKYLARARRRRRRCIR